jgi:hypothetical protein
LQFDDAGKAVARPSRFIAELTRGCHGTVLYPWQAILEMDALSKILGVALGAFAATAASAEPQPAPLPAVVTTALPAPRLATVFELKTRLSSGRGLARMLLDTGVAKADAAEAARLAAGHCDDLAGCSVTVSVSRQLEAGLTVERVVLMGAAGQTVIERRDGRLALNPAAVDAKKAAALI